MNPKYAILVLIISAIGWGITWLPIKLINEMGLDSMHLILIAFLSGAIVSLPWLFRQHALWKSSLGFMLMIGIAGGFANSAFQTAIVHGDVIRVMILFYMLPVWSVIGGRIFLQEKIDILRLSAVILCLAGAAIILDVWNTSWKGISWIDLLAIGSGLGLAATNILFRFTQTIPLMSKISVTFIGCAVIIGIFLGTSENSAALPDNKAIPLAMLYGAIWIMLITIGTQWAVTKMEAGRSSIILVMELVVAVVSAAIISNAQLGINEMIGGAMVIGAALVEGMRGDDETVPKVSDSSIN